MNGLVIALIFVTAELAVLLAAGLLFHDRLRPWIRRLAGLGPATVTPREFADQLIDANQRLLVLKGKMMMGGMDEKSSAACDDAFSALRGASMDFAKHPLASAEYGQAILSGCDRLLELLEDQVSAAEAFTVMQKETKAMQAMLEEEGETEGILAATATEVIERYEEPSLSGQELKKDNEDDSEWPGDFEEPSATAPHGMPQRNPAEDDGDTDIATPDMSF